MQTKREKDNVKYCQTALSCSNSGLAVKKQCNLLFFGKFLVYGKFSTFIFVAAENYRNFVVFSPHSMNNRFLELN